MILNENSIIPLIARRTSISFYICFKPPALGKRNGIILGYFVGYKETHSTTQFRFIPKDIVEDDDPEDMVSVLIPNLKKFTEYTVNVKCHNKMGVGPTSPDIKVSTLEDGMHSFLLHRIDFSHRSYSLCTYSTLKTIRQK